MLELSQDESLMNESSLKEKDEKPLSLNIYVPEPEKKVKPNEE